MAEIINFRRWLHALILAGLLAVVALVIIDWGSSVSYYPNMVVFDSFALAFVGLIAVVTFLWFWMAGDYFKGQSHQTDRSALVLFAVTGAVLMVSFNNMAMLFLGIEILSISLYALAGSKKESLSSNEASFKYFLMGSFATGFLLFGIALVYGATGSFQLDTIGSMITTHPGELPGFFYAGVMLMFIGLGFKISAVPFHFWAPDVYQGSPTPITAFMMTVVKMAAIGAFCRVVNVLSAGADWTSALQLIIILTLVIPNLTAVYQHNVKRMLAYSSVGHVGYILLAFLSGGLNSSGTIFYYLVAYSVATLAAMAVLILMEKSGSTNTIEEFNGLFKRSPLVAVAMTIALMSLAGIPPLAGFFGKYLVFAQAVNNGYVGLVILAVGASLVGVYYYFGVIIAMFFKEPGSIAPVSNGQNALLVLLTLLSIVLSGFPDWVLKLFPTGQ